MMKLKRMRFLTLSLVCAFQGPWDSKVSLAASEKPPPPIRSARSGDWSDPRSWEGKAVPAPGDVVVVRPGHRVRFDARLDQPIRALHIGGTLSFARERDTILSAALIRIQEGEDVSEDGFDCNMMMHDEAVDRPSKSPQAALEVGTASEPIPAGIRAVIRLTYIEGMDRNNFPALVCCGGRMDLHGAPMERTWIKLKVSTAVEDRWAQTTHNPAGWRPGDRLIFTATDPPALFGRYEDDSKMIHETSRDTTHTEERTLVKVEPPPEEGHFSLLVDKPLKYSHEATDTFAGIVANLSRNVIIESAEPDGVRGHTMYHRNSSGSVSYTEFRHLGKKGVLGRYNLHFHLVGDTMRGTSLIGNSFWDSHNRWLTVHGTNDLVVRDCVGYRSLGHGFFLEDGTEVENLFDRNLAVQALRAPRLPDQILPFDRNDGAGFWWANSRNAFTRNVAVEGDQYGYRFEMTSDGGFDPNLGVRQPDGKRSKVDVRTLPFLRFEENEAHAMRRFGLNLGGVQGFASQQDLDDYEAGRKTALRNDVGNVGPDARHPFIIRDFRAWKSGWPVHIGSPSVLINGLTIHDSTYGLWRCRMERHEYRALNFRGIDAFAIYNPWGMARSADEGKMDGLEPVDDLPPVTIITEANIEESGRLVVRGVALDAGVIRRVAVNDVEARSLRGNFADWEAILATPTGASEVTLEAASEDEANNREKSPHRLIVRRPER